MPRRLTLRPGDGVLFFAWPNARTGRGSKRGHRHCPVHAGCGKRCKRVEWHQLCKVHEMAGGRRSEHAPETRLATQAKHGAAPLGVRAVSLNMAVPSDHRRSSASSSVAATRKPDTV